MLLPFTAANNDPGTPDNLAGMLEKCRDELDAVRQDIAWNAGNRSVGDLETRLRRTTERLDNAIGTFERLGRVMSGPAASRAATPILAREADHRTKNGLTTVLALLHRQASTAPDALVGEALRVAGARVSSVTQLHALISDIALVRGEDRELGLDRYLRALCGTIVNMLGHDGDRPMLAIEVEPLSVTPNIAQSLGLVVTELLTNAIRHACLGHANRVRVAGERVDGAYLLSVEDDGDGLPSGFDHRNQRSGSGLRLVNTIADQLRARLVCDAGPVTRFTLVLQEPVGG